MIPPRRVEKPWGHELIWAETERYAAKILTISPGCCLSLQYHERKEETIYVYQGQLEVTFFWGPTLSAETGDPLPGQNESGPRSKIILSPGMSFHIPRKMRHQFSALDDTAIVLEASTPELDDVVRLEDRYGRAVHPG